VYRIDARGKHTSMKIIRNRASNARSPQDLIGGAVLVALALLALFLVQDLPAHGSIGFASGTAPRIFAYGLLGLGLLIMLVGWLREGPKFEALSLRGPVAILGSVLVFAFGIRVFGLALTGVPMVMLAGAAAPGYDWKAASLFAVGITGFCALLFPLALGQPIPLWPTF
jgi:putative tricarboxylic transport membrane protein